jgi:ABC-type antimicrobial peptide transport system permease subunit
MRSIDTRSHFVAGIMLVTNRPTGALLPVLTRMLADVDPNMTIVSVRTMEEQVQLTFDQERAVATLAGLFGLVALTLAAIGLYGVTAYSITQRMNEIGIRMALGADRGNVVQLIMSGAFKRVFLGLIFGLPLAVGAGRLISAQLYGVSPWDPPALAAAAGALAASSFLAAIIPALRAAIISPMRALRTE